jgi:hypothetical protein
MPFQAYKGKLSLTFVFHYDYNEQSIEEPITYHPSEVLKEAPAYYDDQNNERHETVAEWLDRVAPHSFQDSDGNLITAVKFLEFHPDHLFLMRELEAAIRRESNPFLRQRR